VLIAKIGSALKTAFTNSNLPASLKKTAVLTNLLSQQVTKGQKSATVGLLILRGRPKYVKGSDPLVQPKVFARMSNLSGEIFMGTIMDLE